MLRFSFEQYMFPPFFARVLEIPNGYDFVHEIDIRVHVEYLSDRVRVNPVEFKLPHRYVEELGSHRVEMR